MENPDQRALSKWIYAGLSIPEIKDGHGDAGYLLSNMIAKYTLAKNTYLLSCGALDRLRTDNVDLDIIYKRSRFHGKKSPYIYEHSVPVSVVRDQLLASGGSHDEVREILSSSGSVAMILREEDIIISENGLQSKMPHDWCWGDDPFARYHVSGIRIANEVIKVDGRLMR